MLLQVTFCSFSLYLAPLQIILLGLGLIAYALSHVYSGEEINDHC